MRLVRGRLAGVSVRASFGAGAWVGATLGPWVEYRHESLPADGPSALRWISSTWYAVIPLAAIAVATVAGLIGGLVGALLAAAYNRSPRHAAVVVELPDPEVDAGG